MRTLAAIICTAFLAGGCVRPPQVISPAPVPAGPRPRSTAQLTILSPAPGEEFTGPTVTVRLALAHGKITSLTSGPLRSDLGHIHLTVDGQLVSMLAGLEQTFSVGNGMHVLQAEFVAVDHFPFEPRVLTATTFRVK
ncbi:MAG TPA: hypothetical protein VGK88_05975 [bacterium]